MYVERREGDVDDVVGKGDGMVNYEEGTAQQVLIGWGEE